MSLVEMNLSTQSLADLARIINQENRAADEIARAADEAIKAAVAQVAEQAAEPWIVHAIRTGEALIEARKRIPQGGWYGWLKSETEIGPDAAGRYIRVATYQAELPPDVPRGRDEVLALLSGLPNATPLEMYSEEVKIEARRLHSDGRSAEEIRRRLGGGMSLTTIREWTDPDYLARRREQERQRKNAAKARRRAHREMTKRARLLLEQQAERERRDAAAKRVGGDIGEVYSLIRKLTATIDRTATGAVNKDHARALKSLNHRLFQVEDEIVRIIGETNGEAS